MWAVKAIAVFDIELLPLETKGQAAVANMSIAHETKWSKLTKEQQELLSQEITARHESTQPQLRKQLHRHWRNCSDERKRGLHGLPSMQPILSFINEEESEDGPQQDQP